MASVVELERILKVLANRRRLMLLKRMQGGGHLNVGVLAGAIRLSFRATSQHLIKMHQVGLLERKQEGLEVYYSLARNLPPVVKKVLQEL